VTTPAAFRFTFPADPDRHVRAATLLGADPASGRDLRELLPDALVRLMRDIGTPNGIGALGYGEDDVDELVAGTVKQQRLLVIAPRDATEEDLAGIFRSSVENW